VEAVDKKMGAVSEKVRNGALENFPHHLVSGSSPGGGISLISLNGKTQRAARTGGR
jgi:hypothetical protein